MKPKPAALTHARRAAAEIQRLNSELEAAEQNLSALIHSVSHDLHTPLRHIAGYAEILQTAAGQKLDESSRRHLQIIAQAAAQMGQMLDALLALSRLGRAKTNRERVPLTPLVKEAQWELRDEMKGREIDWQIGDLPEVQGDPAMLRQVLVNLLANALKFTRPRPRAKIEIGAKDGGKDTILFVRDNGVGFDMDYAGKMFGVFQRFHPASEFEGTGIGLANVRQIIRRHGGRTWAEGKLEGGATFYCSIPKPLGEAASLRSSGGPAAYEG